MQILLVMFPLYILCITQCSYRWILEIFKNTTWIHLLTWLLFTTISTCVFIRLLPVYSILHNLYTLHFMHCSIAHQQAYIYVEDQWKCDDDAHIQPDYSFPANYKQPK